MSQNTDEYYEPNEFIPERFLSVGEDTGAMDPRKFTFGHGKRFVLHTIHTFKL